MNFVEILRLNLGRDLKPSLIKIWSWSLEEIYNWIEAVTSVKKLNPCCAFGNVSYINVSYILSEYLPGTFLASSSWCWWHLVSYILSDYLPGTFLDTSSWCWRHAGTSKHRARRQVVWFPNPLFPSRIQATILTWFWTEGDRNYVSGSTILFSVWTSQPGTIQQLALDSMINQKYSEGLH